MIVIETITINDKEYIKTYSDENYKIKQTETDTIYDEAIDLTNTNFTYEETDEKIGTEATEEDYIEALERLGVTDEEENIEE